MAGPWQEVDWRAKPGWRLALLLIPWVWMKTDIFFIAQWPGGVTGDVWLTAFTVWECGTRSDGAERETVRRREKRDTEVVMMGRKAKTDRELTKEESYCAKNFRLISPESSTLSFWKGVMNHKKQKCLWE